MSAVNCGTIVGTIVSDIVTRVPSDSLQVTQFRCAPIDAREDDSPVPMTAYNGVGENIIKRYNKGDTVALTYRLRYNTWQTPEGEPRGRMEIVVTSSTTVRLGQISTAQRAAEAAGVDLEGGDEAEEDMGDEPLDMDGEEDQQEEGAMFESDEDPDEDDDMDEGQVYEIDESMLRRELKRLRTLREAANSATAMAHHFGGGKASSDLFGRPVKLNKSDKVTKNETSRGRGRPVKEAEEEEVEEADDKDKKDSKKDSKKDKVEESRRNRALVARLNEATKAVTALNRQLNEQKLFNAKLLYVNKLMQSSSLTDKQFRSIVEALDSAKNLREAHLLYTSLNESLAKAGGRQISEGARTAGGSSRPVGTSSTSLNEGAVVDRWALLAGIKK